MAANKLTATIRTEFGKGAARRARRAGKIPAVLYGHGTDPVHLNLPDHETFLIVRGSANQVITLDIEGRNELALVKDVQIDPVLRVLEHLDLVIVRKGEKVTVNVALHTVGESYPGTLATLEHQNLTVLAPATSIPEVITVDVEGLREGAVVRVRDLTMPEGVTTEIDPETVLVVVSIPRAEASEEEGEETATGAATVEEPEEA